MFLALLLATAASPSAAGAAVVDSHARSASPRQLPLLAVGSPELVLATGPIRPEVGSWAEYFIRSRGEQDVRVRLAIVPPAVQGRVWLEVTTIGSDSLPFAARLLLVTATGQVERATMYFLGQAPLEVPIESCEAEAPLPATSTPPKRVVGAGVRHVTVPAGTFRTTELRISAERKATRLWRSDVVPLWGLVRARGERQSIELVAYAHGGARSVFPAPQGNGSDSAKE